MNKNSETEKKEHEINITTDTDKVILPAKFRFSSYVERILREERKD